MKRGQKPKPDAVKRLEGNPGKRPFNQDAPDLPPPTDDTTPIELQDDAVAIAEWTRLFSMLKIAGALTEGDRGTLIAVCQQWSRYLDANKRIAAAGMVVRAPSGYPMPNPYIAISNKALGNCLKLWVELGLTPSARTRVSVTPEGAPGRFADPFSEFDQPAPTPFTKQ